MRQGFVDPPQGRGRRWWDFALALAAGAVSAYGQPGIGWWPLTLLGLVALSFWAARARTFARAGLIGVGFGTGISAVTTVAAREWALVVPAALTLIGTGLYALPQALWAHRISHRRYSVGAFCSTVAAWSLCMDLGDYIGFPTKAEGLATIAAAPTMLGGARLFGANVACGILIAGILGCGVRLAQPEERIAKSVWLAAQPLVVAIALLLSFSALAHLTAPVALGTISVGIPQLNVPGAYFENRLSLPQVTDSIEELFARQLSELTDVDLLVLTENYDGSYPLQVPKVRVRFQTYARTQQQAVILTSYLASRDGRIYNAAGSIDASGQLRSVHRKVNLAPFGEVEFEAGSTFEPAMVLPRVRAGVLICQETVLNDGPFALARAGANLLVGSTSDISFHSGLLGFEHLAFSRMRAIETGRSLVWASAGGISGNVNRWGEFARGGPFRDAAAVRVNASLYDDLTPYLRTVNLWRALAALTLLGLAFRRGSMSQRARPVQSPRKKAGARDPKRGRGLLSGVSAVSAAVLLTWSLAILSAAAVELVNGTPQRSKFSALEILHRSVPNFGSGSLARFKTDSAHSASGALAYYLDYYGQRTIPSSVEVNLPNPTLHDLAELLRTEQRFPALEQKYDFSDPPRAPTLLRTKDGEFCVATTDRAHRVWLFRPTLSSVSELTTSEAAQQLLPMGIVPGDDPELNAR